VGFIGKLQHSLKEARNRIEEQHTAQASESGNGGENQNLGSET